MYVIHAIRRTFHAPRWALAQGLDCVSGGSHTGTAATVQVPNLGWRVTLSAGAKRRFRFLFRQLRQFCKILPIVKGTSVSPAQYAVQTEAINTDFTGTRRKSRVRF